METLLAGGSFFEAPRWRDGRWWVSDFYRHRVLAVAPGGRAETTVEVEGRPSGLGWLPDGSLLVVSMLDRRLLRLGGDGRLCVHAELAAFCGGHANDLVVDASGRAYVGNFGFDLFAREPPRPAALLRVDPDGTVSVAAADLLFPNGMAISPDGRTLIVAETFAARLTSFAVAADGSLGGRATWAELGAGFSPDGCCLDTDGRVWVADASGPRCRRVARGGAVLDERAVPPGLRAHACMLGGEDGRTLLVCAAPDHSERRRGAADEAVLLTARVDVAHAGTP